jgi:hypothetical protein
MCAHQSGCNPLGNHAVLSAFGPHCSTSFYFCVHTNVSPSTLAAKAADEAIKEDEQQGVPVTDDEKRERDFYYYSSICFVVFAVIVLIVTLFLRTDIRKSIDLYKEASEAIRAMPSMFISPFLTYVWLLAIAVFFIVTGAYLVTTEKHANDLYQNETTFGHVKYVDRGNYDGHFWYFVFAVLWCSQFVIACEEISLAGCVTEWYVAPICRTHKCIAYYTALSAHPAPI